MESLFNKLMDENNEPDSSVMSPQGIAWKLLMEDSIESLSSVITAFSPDYVKEEDPKTFLFELFITVCMELMSQIAIISKSNDNYQENDDPVVLSKKDLNFNETFAHIKKLFAKVSLLFSVNKYENVSSHVQNEIVNKRYCRIVFRYNKKDKKLFDLNEVPDDLNYHFVLNEGYTKKKNLREIYAIIIDQDTIYKLSFDTVEKIGSSGCK